MNEENFPPRLRKISTNRAPAKLLIVCGLLGAVVSVGAYLIANKSAVETVNLINLMLNDPFEDHIEDI